VTDAERAEARALQPPIGREVGQSFVLMGLMAASLASILGLGLLVLRMLG